MNPAQLKALEEAVAKLKEDPTLAYDPSFSQVKDLLTSWGAQVPPAGPKKQEEAPAPEPEPSEEEEEEEPEEPEEEDTERLAEESEPCPEKGPAGEIEFTDEQMDKMGEIKQQGAESLEDGDLKKALEKYTEVVKMGNVTAMVYNKRAELLLKLKRPKACIADCSNAIEVNPDSGKAYRIRGKANRLLGRWEDAHKDLAEGQKLDFDDDTITMQKFVDDKYKKISERQTRQRLRDEKKAKKDREARRAAAKKAYEEQKTAEAAGMGGMGGFPGMGGMGGMPGGMPGMPAGMPGGMPGMPAGMDPSMMSGLLNDPELMAALQNPKMAAAMQEIMSNPGAMAKYANDPEVMNVVQKLMAKMGGAGVDLEGMAGMFGGMPGMGGGAPGNAGGSAASAPPTNEDNVGGASVEEID